MTRNRLILAGSGLVAGLAVAGLISHIAGYGGWIFPVGAVTGAMLAVAIYGQGAQ